MKLIEEEIHVDGVDGAIRTLVTRPAEGTRWPAVLFYTDIFQLTPSTMRTARRLASYGFLVCAPEIYPRGELAGVSRDGAPGAPPAGSSPAPPEGVDELDGGTLCCCRRLERHRGSRRSCRSRQRSCLKEVTLGEGQVGPRSGRRGGRVPPCSG